MNRRLVTIDESGMFVLILVKSMLLLLSLLMLLLLMGVRNDRREPIPIHHLRETGIVMLLSLLLMMLM